MDRVIFILGRLGYRSLLYLGLIGIGLGKRPLMASFVSWYILSLGTFCLWDVLSVGGFGLEDVLTWDVLSCFVFRIHAFHQVTVFLSEKG